jgi:threonine/homoserine/homoserine lactone efflux protein
VRKLLVVLSGVAPRLAGSMTVDVDKDEPMIESWFFLLVVATILLTPGPTNTLLAASGIQQGFRASLPLIPAEAAGYLCAIVCWGVLLSQISVTYPMLPVVLKLLSAVYILWLAVKLWKTANAYKISSQRTVRPRELFFATLLNPKALLFALTVFPQSTWQSLNAFALVALAFLSLLVPIASLWIYFGRSLSKGSHRWLSAANLQRGASMILAGFTVPITYSALSAI